MNKLVSDCIIMGSNVGNEVLALRLAKEGKKVAYVEKIKEKGGVCGYYVMPMVNDVGGIVQYVLEKVGLEKENFLVQLDNSVIEKTVIDEKVIFRTKEREFFIEKIAEISGEDKEKLGSFFNLVWAIGKENWNVLYASRLSTENMHLFLRYYQFSYQQLIEQFNFSPLVKRLLLLYAPWDGISLVTMSGYWLQISDVGVLGKRGERLREMLHQEMRNFSNLFCFSDEGGGEKIRRKEKGWEVHVENTVIEAPILVHFCSREVLGKYAENIEVSMSSFFRQLGLFVAFYRVKEMAGEGLSSEAMCVRGMVEKKNVNIRFMGYFFDENDMLRIDVYGDSNFIKEEWDFLIGEIMRQCGVFSYEEMERYDNESVEEITGFKGGDVNKWAHSVEEIKKNPLTSLEVSPGSKCFCMGDWGNGYFYAAEIYFREIMKILKEVQK